MPADLTASSNYEVTYSAPAGNTMSTIIMYVILASNYVDTEQFRASKKYITLSVNTTRDRITEKYNQGVRLAVLTVNALPLQGGIDIQVIDALVEHRFAILYNSRTISFSAYEAYFNGSKWSISSCEPLSPAMYHIAYNPKTTFFQKNLLNAKAVRKTSPRTSPVRALMRAAVNDPERSSHASSPASALADMPDRALKRVTVHQPEKRWARHDTRVTYVPIESQSGSVDDWANNETHQPAQVPRKVASDDAAPNFDAVDVSHANDFGGQERRDVVEALPPSASAPPLTPITPVTLDAPAVTPDVHAEGEIDELSRAIDLMRTEHEPAFNKYYASTVSTHSSTYASHAYHCLLYFARALTTMLGDERVFVLGSKDDLTQLVTSSSLVKLLTFKDRFHLYGPADTFQSPRLSRLERERTIESSAYLYLIDGDGALSYGTSFHRHFTHAAGPLYGAMTHVNGHLRGPQFTLHVSGAIASVTC